MLRKRIVEWIAFGSAFGGGKSSNPVFGPQKGACIPLSLGVRIDGLRGKR